MARGYPVRALALVAAAALALSACGDDDDEATPGPESTASAKVNTGNGVLKIGTLLPEGQAALASTTPADLAAIKLAIEEINEAGGVLGKDVTITSADSGDASTTIASQSTDRLLSEEVDVIIGANSSAVTLNVLDKITDRGVLQISPGNTSTKLTDVADKGLYFRTAPSDVYQGRVVAQTALEDEAETLGILALQDAYGTSLADQAKKTFVDGGGTMAPSSTVIYDPKASDFASEVGKIADADPDAIMFISLGEADLPKILEEMVKQDLLPLSKSGKKMYFVDGNLLNDIKVPAGTLEGIKGTNPGAEAKGDFKQRLDAAKPGLVDYRYAGEAYDAAILVALAAEAANSDAGTEIAKKMQDVSAGGEKCDTFAKCVALLKDDKDIDYEGRSGPVEFDSLGNPSVAAMGIYEYGKDNKFKPLEFVTGSISGSGSSSSSSAAPSSPSASASEASESPEPTSTSSASATSSP